MLKVILMLVLSLKGGGNSCAGSVLQGSCGSLAAMAEEEGQEVLEHFREPL
jgi:hypothetical protein